MELKCNGCSELKHYFDFDWCKELKEALPNGYAKLYWSEQCEKMGIGSVKERRRNKVFERKWQIHPIPV